MSAAVGSKSQVRAATLLMGPAAPPNAPPNCVRMRSIFFHRPASNVEQARDGFLGAQCALVRL
jgi:hypothetical protein